MINEIGKINLNSKHTHLKMWEVTVEGGYRGLREHRHINFEISLVLQGNGLYRTSYGDREINTGDVFVFTSNEPHCITEISSNRLKLLNLQFSNRIIENLPHLDKNYPYIFFNHSENFDCKVYKDSAKETAHLIKKIREEFKNAKECYSAAIINVIGEIFIEFIRNHGYCLNDDNISESNIKKLEKGIDFINANYTENLTLEIIAEKSNITPNYFSALFKECLNMKLWDYITAKRIEKAQRMLKNDKTELTILEIANECGFNNTANFNRAFKLHTGITPSEYKKSRFESII